MAIQHVFSNAIADGTNTNIVRPSDWNSHHNNNVTLSGNTLGVATVSGTNIVFAGGPNVTLSAAQGANAATISFSGGAGAAGNTGYLSAGTTNASMGTISFANSNGVSFGIDGQTITATVATNYQSAGAYLTTARASNDAIGLNSALTANGVSVTANSAGLSLNFPAFLTTAMASNRGSDFVQAAAVFAGTNASGTIASNGLSVSVNAQSVQPVAASAANGSYAFSTLSFSNANGISFGTSAGSAITASHNALTTAALSDHSHGNPTLALTNLTGTTASNSAGFTLSLSAGAPGGGALSVGNSNLGNTAGDTGVFTGRLVFVGSDNITLSGSSNGGSATLSIYGPSPAGGGITAVKISAGTTSNNLSALTFSDSNGISFGINASTITASHNGLTSQSNQALSGSNGSFAFQTATFGNLNGMSFYTSNGSMVGSYTVPTQSNQTLGIYAVGNTTGQSSSSTYDARTLSIDGAGIVSAGWSNGTLRISATQSNQAFSADASSTFQTLSLQDSNGISFSNNAGAIRLTHALQFTSATSAITSNALHSSAARVFNIVAATNNAAGGTASLSSNVSFSAANGITFYTSAGNAIVASHNGLTSQSNQAFSADASSTFQTLSFQNSNGFTFSNNAGAIRASYSVPVVSNAIQAVGTATGSGTNVSRFAADDHVHAGVFSMGVTNAGNSAGDTRVDVGRFVLAGGANITLSQATAANGLNTISIVGATAAASPVNMSAGTTSNNLATVVFSNSNGVSFGLNGSTITASVNAGAGGFGSIGISTQGNSSGTTGFASASMQLVGSNNITLSQATAANGAYTLTISGPSRPRINLYAPLDMQAGGSAAAGFSYVGYSNGTLHVQPLHGLNGVFPGDMTVDRFGLLWTAVHANSTATTQAMSSTIAIGIYTLANATQLSRQFSGTASFGLAANNGNSSLLNGMRWITINSNQWDTQPTLSNTLYWIASFAVTGGTSFSNQGAMGVRLGHSAPISGILGAASGSAVSNPVLYPFRGYGSVSTAGLPAAIAASDLILTGSGF